MYSFILKQNGIILLYEFLIFCIWVYVYLRYSMIIQVPGRNKLSNLKWEMRGREEGFKVHGGWAQAWDWGRFLSQEGLSQVKYSSKGGRVKCFGYCEMAAELLCVSAVLIVLSALRGSSEEEETRSWKSWWSMSVFKVILVIRNLGIWNREML